MKLANYLAEKLVVWRVVQMVGMLVDWWDDRSADSKDDLKVGKKDEKRAVKKAERKVVL